MKDPDVVDDKILNKSGWRTSPWELSLKVSFCGRRAPSKCSSDQCLMQTQNAPLICIVPGLEDIDPGCPLAPPEEDVDKVAPGCLSAPTPPGNANDRVVSAPWPTQRFQQVRKLQTAERNHGEVVLFEDIVDSSLVAVKVMPLTWVCRSDLEFANAYPKALEHPWLDIKTSAHLTQLGFPHICPFKGLYVSADRVLFVQGYANGGDLFEYVDKARKRRSSKGLLGKPRDKAQVAECRDEGEVRMIFKKLLVVLQDFHTTAKLAHRDVSLENVMLHWPDGLTGDDKEPELKLVDFGMARSLESSNWIAEEIQKPNFGKASYTAPELHDPVLADSQEAVDIFAVGVILYVLLTGDYPWLRTRRGEDMCHDYFLDSGAEAFLRKRIGGKVVADMISIDAMVVLKELLQRDPKKRGRLKDPCKDRKSIWRHAWWTAS